MKLLPATRLRQSPPHTAHARTAPVGPVLLALALSAFAVPVRAEDPFFVTYSHHLEEPGNLELSYSPLLGKPQSGNFFLGSLLELEYGTTAWWTSELYLTGQSTSDQGTCFTGYRIENRIRPWMGLHKVNPVLYVEFENTNEADKTLREVVGFDSQDDLAEPVSTSRREKEKEVELKLILGSDFKDWTIAENFVAEKDLAAEPWEFGYAIGAAHPLSGEASPGHCNFCRENFSLGAELYGGLGDAHSLTLKQTAHYVAPVLGWELPNGVAFKLSPTFGLTHESIRSLLRFSVSYEITGFGRKIRNAFH